MMRSKTKFVTWLVLMLSMATSPAISGAASAGQASEIALDISGEDWITIQEKALAEVREELSAEKHRLDEAQQAGEAVLDTLRTKALRLAAERVDRRRAIGQKKRHLAERQAQRSELQAGQYARERDKEGTFEIAAEAVVKLADWLEVAPPSPRRKFQREQLDKLQASLGETRDLTTCVKSLLALTDSLLQESHDTKVAEMTVRIASGRAEAVKLLQVGHVLYAYQGQNSGRVGVAVGAPQGERGYRWRERIPGWAQEEIAWACHTWPARTGCFFVPVDVTQGLAAERVYEPQSTWKELAAGGPVMIPLGLVALAAILLCVERTNFLRRQGRQSEMVAEEIFRLCHAGNYGEAEVFAGRKEGVVARVLKACLVRRREGVVVMEDAIQESLLHELPHIERFLPTIGILGSVAPLLGLLGTVTGMISTFEAITVYGGSEPRLMAGGISEALLTTAAGLIIAIPILIVHRFLASRLARLTADTERFAATLLMLLREVRKESEEAISHGDRNDT